MKKLTEKKVFAGLCSIYEYKFAIDLLLQKIMRDNKKLSPGPTIFIAGVSRVGKSIIAKSIAEEQNYGLINLDKYRYIWNSDSIDGSSRRDLKKYFFTNIIKLSYFGMVIEGDELITDARPNLISHQIKHDLTLDYLLYINKLDNVKVFVLGTSKISVEEKVSTMVHSAKKKNCWAVDNLSMDRIVELSKVIISMSSELHKLSTNNGITYIDINSKNLNLQKKIISKIINM